MQTPTATTLETRLFKQFHWSVEVFECGRWQHTATVQTWCNNRSLAIRKAQIDSPALRGRRLRANLLQMEDIAELGMTLSTDPNCESKAAWYVYDRHNCIGEVRQLNSILGLSNPERKTQ